MTEKKNSAKTADEEVRMTETNPPAAVPVENPAAPAAGTRAAVVLARNGLNLRAAPLREADVLAVLPRDAALELVPAEEPVPGWERAVWKGLSGWVMAQYIREEEG